MEETTTGTSDNASAHVNVMDEEGEVGQDEVNREEHSEGGGGDVDHQRTAAMFILKAKEVRMLTQDSLDGLLEDITGKLKESNVMHDMLRRSYSGVTLTVAFRESVYV